MEEETTRLGRYELISRIGHGGMAEVRLALQRGPAGFEKLVVIKLVHEKLAVERRFVDMLLDEARVAALVKHPNVVDIYDLGEVDGRFFIAMEYLEGEPLLAILRAGREGQRLDALSTARLIADTAEGLDAAHELRSLAGEPLGLVHHDVSLGNIVVLYNGQVKLVDFGVARATEHAGPTLKVHGKSGYMAPEKLKGVPGDRRSDIWSLGVVLWEALTLRRLFRGAGERETLRMVLHHEIAPPSTVCADVPADLDAVVMRALERDPDRRYATAKELSHDLEERLVAHRYGRQGKIAQYMQATFQAHIVARRELMREISTKGTASAEVLEAVFEEAAKFSIPGELSIRFKSPTSRPKRNTFTTEVPSAEGTPIQDILERRARNSEQMMAEGTPHSQLTPLPVETPDFPSARSSWAERDAERAVLTPPPAADPAETVGAVAAGGAIGHHARAGTRTSTRDLPPRRTPELELAHELTAPEQATTEANAALLEELATMTVSSAAEAHVERKIRQVRASAVHPAIVVEAVEPEAIDAPAPDSSAEPLAPALVEVTPARPPETRRGSLVLPIAIVVSFGGVLAALTYL